MSDSYRVEGQVEHRPTATESQSDFHSRIVQNLARLPSDWRLSRDDIPPPKEDFWQTQIALGSWLPDGVFAAAYYGSRDQSVIDDDDAAQNDFLMLAFDIDERDKEDPEAPYVPYERVAMEGFPHYIEAFCGYYAELRPNCVMRDEHLHAIHVAKQSIGRTEFEKLGKFYTGRDSIYWINPVMYFDRLLSQRAFRLEPEAIVEKSSGHVDTVEPGAHTLPEQRATIFGQPR